MATIVSKEYATALLGQLDTIYGTGGGYEVALLTSAPDVTSGTLDISTAELDGVTASPGYARIDLDSADFTAASGNNPVTSSNTGVLTTEYNSSEANWEAINYVALVDAADSTTVLLVVSTAAPVVIAAGRRARIPIGALTLRMASA